jgi:hypothetical protein
MPLPIEQVTVLYVLFTVGKGFFEALLTIRFLASRDFFLCFCFLHTVDIPAKDIFTFSQ